MSNKKKSNSKDRKAPPGIHKIKKSGYSVTLTSDTFTNLTSVITPRQGKIIERVIKKSNGQ